MKLDRFFAHYALWRYYRFSLSFRDVEDLMAARGVTVSYETVRRWTLKFGQRALKTRGYRARTGTMIRPRSCSMPHMG